MQRQPAPALPPDRRARAGARTEAGAAALARRAWRSAHALARNTSGVSLVEFALSLPLLTILTFYGLEVAYMATVNTQVSQIAISVADNASRLGQTDQSTLPPSVNEADIDAVLQGALRQGAGINFSQNGKIILSSLELHPTQNKQYIHWQRCVGSLNRISTYGAEGAGLDGSLVNGMGKQGHRVTAPAKDQAVMFVEVYYSHVPLLGLFDFVVPDQVRFKQEAAFLVRDKRTLDSMVGTKKSSC